MNPRNLIARIPKSKLYCSIILIAVILLCIIISFIYYTHKKSNQTAENNTIVQTTIISNSSSTPEYTYSGEVCGRYESQLSFQINGKIIKRNVELGSTVTAGDILMQIDPKDVQQAVNDASAKVSSAESQLYLAENNLNRFSQLYNDGVVSKMTYDQYLSTYNVAAAALQQASANYVQETNQLNYSLLRADKPGIISAINAEAGQVVSAGQSVITIVQNGEREIEIHVPENQIEELENAPQIEVTFWALPDLTLAGKVREIAPMADPATRTYKVRISLINPPDKIKLGMTASVTLFDASDSKVINIPLTALYQNSDTPSVWLVDGNTITLHPIKIGQINNNTVQVLDGLNQGDQIVTAGVHKLREGEVVQVGGGTL